MLIITRKAGQKLFIGNNNEIALTIVDLNENGVTIVADTDQTFPLQEEEGDRNYEQLPMLKIG